MARITKTIGFGCSDGTSHTSIEDAQRQQAYINLVEVFGSGISLDYREIADKWFELYTALRDVTEGRIK